MIGALKVFLKAKFVSFDSLKSGFFLAEFFLNREKKESEFLLANFNLCMSSSQSLYDEVDTEDNHVKLYKVIVEKKKESGPSVYSKISSELNAFFQQHFNDLFVLDNHGKFILNKSLEFELKSFINKKISSKVFNAGLDKFNFIYSIDVLSEEDEFMLRKEYFSDKSEEDNVTESIDVYQGEQRYLENLHLVLSPSQGISIFLIRPGDIVYVRVISNSTGSQLLDYNENSVSEEQEVVVEQINFKDNYTEILVKFNDGAMGRIEETEMVKVKGIQNSDLIKYDNVSDPEDSLESNPYSFVREFSKNFLLLVVIVLLFIVIVLFLSDI